MLKAPLMSCVRGKTLSLLWDSLGWIPIMGGWCDGGSRCGYDFATKLSQSDHHHR